MDIDNKIADDFEWFDVWCELHSELLDQKDYPALVQLCKQRFTRDPVDPHAMEALAEAYVLNRQPQEALDLTIQYYEREPDNPIFQACILDALRAMGKGIDDFPWRFPPDVLRISDGVLEEFYRFLKPRRKPRTVLDLYTQFFYPRHICFSQRKTCCQS
jgi:hypothetical protein